MANMATLENLANVELTLRPGHKARGGMTFYPLATPYGADPHILLGPVGTFPASIPFEPSTFGGRGGEPRKSIRFSVCDERIVRDMQNLEEKAQYLLAKVSPKIIWNSAITEATELHLASIKAKIWVTGERAAHIRDEGGQLIPMPGQPWPRPSANAAIDVRGIYHMANGTAGLRRGCMYTVHW